MEKILACFNTEKVRSIDDLNLNWSDFVAKTRAQSGHEPLMLVSESCTSTSTSSLRLKPPLVDSEHNPCSYYIYQHNAIVNAN